MFEKGDRVIVDIARRPEPDFSTGATGTVTNVDTTRGLVGVRFDEPHDGVDTTLVNLDRIQAI